MIVEHAIKNTLRKIATPQNIHPHPDPLPSREREIREVGCERLGSQ
jgi:hypothetical protein